MPDFTRSNRSFVSTCAATGRATALLLGALLVACESVPEYNTGPSDPLENGDGDGNSTGDGDGDLIVGSGGSKGGDGDGDTSTDAECGNGELEPGELCDDGNTKDGDGCEGGCDSQDPDYDCSIPGAACINTVICGNGVLEGDEICDDGNTDNGDGCRQNCSTIDDGYECTRPGVPCVLVPVCGNGTRERGEQCDDGEATPSDGDGCSASCQLEDGFFCGAAGSPCVPLVCGDGTRTPDEECDDGVIPAVDGDGCSASCTVESGYRCSAAGCNPACGDGRVVGAEGCDDGNRQSGDGCTSACVNEPFYSCTHADNGVGMPAGPSTCTSTIICGDTVVDPGEICDPPGVNGCEAGCKTFAPDAGLSAVCGNNILEFGETCDGPAVPFAGCQADCSAAPGYSCPRPGECFVVPACGDGIVQIGEECDVGPASSPACLSCNVQDTWFCYGSGPSTCEQSVCGDAIRASDEECEDTNAVDDDGCTSCTVDSGWVCPSVGKPCVPVCGDGLVLGLEVCDDGNATPGDGCSATCRVEPGHFCTTQPCADGEVPADTTCGNGIIEGSESCDDGANDQPFDGCYECKKDPVCTNGTCVSTCGDGQRFSDEDCDDGNTDDGDGCSSLCEIESGFDCQDFTGTPPDSIQLPVIFRDFIGLNRTTGGSTAHPDFNGLAGGTALGMAKQFLNAQNKPEWAWVAYANSTGTTLASNGCTCDDDGTPSMGSCYCDNPGHRTISTRPHLTTPAQYAEWYTDVPAVNVSLVTKLDLPRDTGTGQYIFDSGAAPNPGYMDPFNTGGWVALGKETMSGCSPNRNVSWTSETHFWFEYAGGERFDFSGDDDTWVFVNGQLVVDLGGLHGPLTGWFQLDADTDGAGPDTANGDASVTQSLITGTNTISLGLVPGGVYEVSMFQAERNQCGSNFKVTLKDFNKPKSVCTPICGDEEVVGTELCDDGTDNADGVYGACNTTCSGRLYCGDHITTSPPEACDNGKNVDTYDVGQPNACDPSCQLPGSCGDNTVQGAFEVCDNGGANDDGSYGTGSCTSTCGLGGYCGDGTHQSAYEACDNGVANTAYNLSAGACGYDCLPAPFCGDNLRNGPEECDDGTDNGTPSSNCGTDCKILPFCGDGQLQSGEACDFGAFASDAYGGCDSMCIPGGFCGDGTRDDGYEECDLGAANDDDVYGGCSTACVPGPSCGDAIVQAQEGEACDNGFNDDDYLYTPTSCGAGCTTPPRCGDGTVQSAFEQCDNGKKNSDGAYDGCTTACEWGPYCGDGAKDPQETCDDGADNTAYSPDGASCGYDCKPSPYCGDGERNGPEQCDDGTKKNTGGYGKCKADCTRAAYCGDGIVQRSSGESCDDGPIGSTRCTPGCQTRAVVK